MNLPVPGRSGDETYVSLVEHVVAPLARAYGPDLVLVSARGSTRTPTTRSRTAG